MSTSFSNDGAVDKPFTDAKGNVILTRCATGDIPSAVAGYAVGCLLQDTTTGTQYTNTGTVASCTFTAV